MLDPKISNLVSRDLAKDCIVVFDEAHNIDNICIEALSVRLDRRRLHTAMQNLSTLNNMVLNMEQNDVDRLNDEYKALVQGLINSNTSASTNTNVNANASQSRPSLGIDMSAFTDTLLANPVLSDDILQQAIPGNIRKSKHFLNFLKTLIEYLKQKMSVEKVIQEETLTFISDFQKTTGMHENQLLALRFCHDRLHSLFRTLMLTDLDVYTPLVKVTTLASLVGTYSQGFKILIEPYDTRTPTIKDPILQLCCLDASIAMQPVLKKFRNVIITSGCVYF
ncbi:hypothetical protein RFI_21141 [Reticulomyxa filosa]|uniref:DNA 5'-3' helicase n=1 Tax=Reticulomyxa filosa TaxID=46433 RepID=X6MSX8_RETFI|nr:hypothetical protein RFI_21141 [Reticulomyxa filosa]|eukprot:ETO16215.1 hypothetical protein RFI_21141 [Reticulomyxa filosa]